MEFLLGIGVGFAIGIATGIAVGIGVQKNIITNKISKYIKAEEINMINKNGEKISLNDLLGVFNRLYKPR